MIEQQSTSRCDSPLTRELTGAAYCYPFRWLLVLTALAAGFVAPYSWVYARAAAQIQPFLSDVDGPLHGDFGHFYHGAKAMRDHENPYTSWKRGYIYPPLMAFLLMPLTLLPAETAARVFIGFNIALSIALSLLVARESARRFASPDPVLITGAALLATFLLIDKIRGEMRMGQTNTWMLAAFVLGLVWMDRRPWLAGLALGFGFNIKYLPVVMLPYLLFRRRWNVAAGFILGAIGFALLPAIWSGWHENLRHLAVAYSGLLKLVGLETGAAEAANLESISAPLSVSVTSMVSRAIGGGQATWLVLAVSLGTALGVAGVMLAIARRAGVPLLFRWLTAQGAASQSETTLLEWLGLLVFVLAFSPQTNTRHLYLVLFVLTAAAVILLKPPAGVSRRPLVVGVAVLTLGLNFPQFNSLSSSAALWWAAHAGPTVCLLFMYGTLLWTGLCVVRTSESRGLPPAEISTQSPWLLNSTQS
jgi:hypothetical protein